MICRRFSSKRTLLWFMGKVFVAMALLTAAMHFTSPGECSYLKSTNSVQNKYVCLLNIINMN